MRVYVRHTLTHTGIHMLTYIHRHTHKSTQAYTHICSHAYVCVCMSACIYCTHTHAHPHRPPSGYDSRSARQKACIISPCVVILDVQQLRLDTQPPDQHPGSRRGARHGAAALGSKRATNHYHSHIILVGGAAVRGHSGQNVGVGRSSFILLRFLSVLSRSTPKCSSYSSKLISSTRLKRSDSSLAVSTDSASPRYGQLLGTSPHTLDGVAACMANTFPGL